LRRDEHESLQDCRKRTIQDRRGRREKKNQPGKRVNIVSLRMVKESSILYKDRQIKSPEDGYNLMKELLDEADREYFVVVCLDTKNQPTHINVCHVGSLNASIVHPREVMKSAILSNARRFHLGDGDLGQAVASLSTINIKGESYRIKEKKKAGFFKPKPAEEKEVQS
jgi:DNA repair protein RadC